MTSAQTCVPYPDMERSAQTFATEPTYLRTWASSDARYQGERR